VRSVIHKFSSDSVEIFWFDLDAARANVAAAVQEMAAAHPEVNRVVLFGSLARGDAAPGSDADIVIVLLHSDLPFLERICRYAPAYCGIGVDVFPYTREEFEAKRAASPLWARDIEQGVTLFERGGAVERAPAAGE